MAFRTLAALAVVPIFAATLTAQSEGTVQAGPTIAKPKNVLSTQPLSIILTVYNAEFERAMGATWTAGVTASYWAPDFDEGDESDFSYASGDIKFRYYPGAKPLEGFSFGGSVGMTRISEEFLGEKAAATGPSIGTYLDYGWLLGPTNRFYVGLGFGAKAVFVNDNDFASSDPTVRYPTARISVGFGF